jgi:hypothetical protein
MTKNQLCLSLHVRLPKTQNTMLRCTTKSTTLRYHVVLNPKKLSPFNMRDLRSPPLEHLKLYITSCSPYKSSSSPYFQFQLSTLEECAHNSKTNVDNSDGLSALLLCCLKCQHEGSYYITKTKQVPIYVFFFAKDLNDQIMLRVACSPSTKPLEIVRNTTRVFLSTPTSHSLYSHNINQELKLLEHRVMGAVFLFSKISIGPLSVQPKPPHHPEIPLENSEISPCNV